MSNIAQNSNDLPLSGVKVVEFTHMVMGPAVGVILADMGADVVKVEPINGDNTRRLKGSGAGYFSMYNRNKKSLCIDLKSVEGKKIIDQLIESADVVIENFRPGAMDKLGLGFDQLSKLYPRLIYCSLKGFLSGPYEHRTALDEVAQMMGGLAYMTGLPNKPMRAGSSVIDITGGMFGVIAILGALQQRHNTGKGQHVTSSLFETTAFMVGQHMAQQAVSGQEPPPMSVRSSAWSVYDIFTASDGERIFVGVVSDSLWKRFCTTFALAEFANDESLNLNAGRVEQRDIILPVINRMFASMSGSELSAKLDEAGVPFSPINKPADLFDDPHLNSAGGLLDLTLSDGSKVKLPALPIEMNGKKFSARLDIPKEGEHSIQALTDLGLKEETIADLLAKGVIRKA